ncbi:MAG: MAPEG family protein [Novosphingobium sp.]|nr:MAPEG family protein [Novosphingobium sp.]
MRIDLLWPTFALVAWIYVVWFWMYVERFRHMRRQPPTTADFASGAAAMDYFEPVEMPANNLRNLFEMPVLYFAIVPLLMFTYHASHIQVALAWSFVALRVVHSLVQIVAKRVPLRFLVYLLSSAVLLAMWIGFAVDMLAAPGI